MVFYFLIFTVFVAEIIIAVFLITNLLKINKSVIECNRFLFEAKPAIKEIGELGRKISEQGIELANLVVERIEDYIFDYIAKYFKGVLTGLLILEIKRKLRFR